MQKLKPKQNLKKKNTYLFKASLYSPNPGPSQWPQGKKKIYFEQLLGNLSMNSQLLNRSSISHHKKQNQTLPVKIIAAQQSRIGGSGCRMNIFILIFSLLTMYHNYLTLPGSTNNHQKNCFPI